MSKTIVFVAITVIAIALFAAAPAANATLVASVDCNLKNVPPNGTTSCPGLGPVVGYGNLALTLLVGLDVTYNPNSPPGSATFAIDSPLTSWDVASLVVNNINRPLSASYGPFAISDLDYSTNFENPFLVDVQAVLGGTATNANAFLTYQLTGETPEPSTWVLLGSALVGLAVYRRRKVVN